MNNPIHHQENLAINHDQTVPCELCGEPTPMMGTKRCDRCFELESRLRNAPAKLIENILHNLGFQARIMGHADP